MSLKNEESSDLEKSLIEQVSFLLDNKSCIDFLSSSDNFLPRQVFCRGNAIPACATKHNKLLPVLTSMNGRHLRCPMLQ